MLKDAASTSSSAPGYEANVIAPIGVFEVFCAVVGQVGYARRMLLFLLAAPVLASPPTPGGSVTVDAVEAAARKTALDAHQRARASGNPADFQAADVAYGGYFDVFSASPYAYDMHYAWAELLYKMKQFERAYSQYQAVVTLDPAGPRSAFSAESALFAADELLNGGRVPRDPEPRHGWVPEGGRGGRGGGKGEGGGEVGRRALTRPSSASRGGVGWLRRRRRRRGR